MRLREHDISLRGAAVTLRPLTEDDWGILLPWGSDPEVLWFSEGDDVQSYSLEDIQGIYREVSQAAFCFVIELDGRAIGDCWLQEMNIPCAEDKGHRYCFECDEFPCDRLNAFASDGHEHHRLAVENLKAMREMGPEKWIAQQPKPMFCPGWRF